MSITIISEVIPSTTVPPTTSSSETTISVNILGMTASIVLISAVLGLGVLVFRTIVGYGKKKDDFDDE